MEKAIVNLNTKALIKYCSNGYLPDEDLYFRFRMINRRANSNIHTVFGYRKFNDDFVDKVTIYESDDLDGLGTIRFSYNEFLLKLFKFLNVSSKPNEMTDEEISSALIKRVEVLNMAYQKEFLYNEFPVIFNDYLDGLNYLEAVTNMKVTTEAEKDHKDILEKYYYRCALQPNFDKFLGRQKNLYSRFVYRKEDYKKAVEESNLNNFFKKYFDMNKVAMYIANYYLNLCEYLEEEKQIKYYMSLVEKYLKSDYDKSIVIEVENNLKINIDVIRERYSKIKKKFTPEIGIVNWELIPPGKDYIMRGESTPRSRVTLSEEELATLRSKGQKKKDFYEKSNPLAKAYGTLKNNCYIAYIYKNGEVLLDTLYDDNYPKTAVGNATYNIKARNFELISGLDKSKLKHHPNVNKLNHSKNWEERVLDIINRDNSNEEKDDAIKLVKRLKK